MSLFGDLKNAKRLERKHARDQWLVDLLVAVAGLLAGAALLGVAIWLTR